MLSNLQWVLLRDKFIDSVELWYAVIIAIRTIQEPMSRSKQQHYIPITAFSGTDLFLDRISLE